MRECPNCGVDNSEPVENCRFCKQEMGERAAQCPSDAADCSASPIYGVMDPDYARFLSKARCTAKMDGYALAIHGTFSRDLDVIAIPWVEKPKAAEAFVRHIAHRTGMLIHHPMQLREHGRMVWTLHFPDFGDPRFIDFSVIPTISSQNATRKP